MNPRAQNLSSRLTRGMNLIVCHKPNRLDRFGKSMSANKCRVDELNKKLNGATHLLSELAGGVQLRPRPSRCAMPTSMILSTLIPF